MFGKIKDSWQLARIGASIEGVVRESENGDGSKVMQWYADFLMYSQQYAKKKHLSSESVFQKAMGFTQPANGPAFKELVARLTAPGKLLHEIHRQGHARPGS